MHINAELPEYGNTVCGSSSVPGYVPTLKVQHTPTRELRAKIGKEFIELRASCPDRARNLRYALVWDMLGCRNIRIPGFVVYPMRPESEVFDLRIEAKTVHTLYGIWMTAQILDTFMKEEIPFEVIIEELPAFDGEP